MGEEIGKYGTNVPLTQVSDLLLFGNDNKTYNAQEHSDKYELFVGFDKYYPYDEAKLTGKVRFDLIVKNNNSGNSIRIENFSGDFRKELTPSMFADKLTSILEMADLLSEDPGKFTTYENWLIAYTVIEGTLEVVMIILEIYDLCMIATLSSIPFVGWALSAYYF
jgi:hypothetical protein